MGLPDHVLQTSCDIAIIKKRYKVAKEIEEIGEEHTEELSKEADQFNNSIAAW
jgi:hypothetical protein